MGMKVLIALAVAALPMGAATAFAAKEAPVDAAWRACAAQPTRACVAARAMALVRGIDNEDLRARMFGRVLETAVALRPNETAALAREAEAIAGATKDDKQRDGMLVGVVKAYVSARDFAAATAVLARFKDKLWEGEGVVQIAIGLGHEKRVDDAVALLRAHRATKDDWQAWSRAAWSLREVAVARGETAALLALLQEAQPHYGAARGKGTESFHYIHHPTIFVEPLLIVLAEQTAQGQVQEALTVARAVEDKRARMAVLGGIAAVLAIAGRTDEALEVALAQPVEEQGGVVGKAASPIMVDPLSDKRYDRDARGLVTGPFPKIARPAAPAFAASMRLAARFDAAKDDRDSAYGVIALANAREDAVAQAVKAAGLMKSGYLLRTTLTELGEAQSRVGDRAQSIKTFARVRELILTEATTPDGWEWREGSLSELAQLQARLGQIEEALAIVRAMKGNEMTTIAILNDGRQVSMDYNRRQALYEIARAMAKAGRVDEAFAIARETEHPDVGGVGNGLGVVAEGLAEAGRLDDALVALKAVAEDRDRDGALLYIVRWRLKAGLTGDSDRLLAAFAGNGSRALAMGETAAAVLKAGDAARALALVKQALQLTDGLAPEPAIDALNQAVRGLAA
jgi:tetratricopeptide (TPR) repeat protein